MHDTLGAAFHTFTMIGRCAKTGLLGICMTSSPLCVAARCAFIKGGLAAVVTQAYSDPALGPLALNLLESGYTVERTIAEMCANDEWTEYRQHGIVDRNGRTAAFTGKSNLDWKGHLNGPNY